MSKNRQYAFWSGWNQLCQLYGMRVQVECKKQLMKTLGITNENSWRMWRRGCYSDAITVKQVKAITSVFAEYRITQVWGGNSDDSAIN